MLRSQLVVWQWQSLRGEHWCYVFLLSGALTLRVRYLPLLVDKVEKICEDEGLRSDSIVMRMTGCPNGCARPWNAEIAFVGKAPGSYMVS